MLRCSKDIVPLFVESCKQGSRESTVSSDFFFPFFLPYGGGLLTDGASTPENSRAATTSRWGGNQILSDVYSNCLTWALWRTSREWSCLYASGRVGGIGEVSPEVESKTPPLLVSHLKTTTGELFVFYFPPSWINFILLYFLIPFLFPVVQTDSLTFFITWHGSACHTSRPCDTNESTRKRQNMFGNRKEKK